MNLSYVAFKNYVKYSCALRFKTRKLLTNKFVRDCLISPTLGLKWF